jgi:hypothetical protein
MTHQLTEKGRNLITTKIFNGELYALMDKNEEQEVWLRVVPPEISSCERCGYQGPAIDEHHVYGRKNSDEVVNLCSNCHRELHAGLWEYRL